MTRRRLNVRVVGGRIGATALIVLALAACCSRLPERMASRAEAFQKVRERRQGFAGVRAGGSLILEHKADKLTIPIEVTVTEDLVLEVRGEISHFLLPFEGEVRLVSDEATTLLHTNVGTYDLAMDPQAQPAVRAFLLSLAGGGDWLLWWLAANGCDLGVESRCKGLEIRLEPHDTLPSMGRWEVREPSRGAVFKAQVDEYEPGTLFPQVITGIIEPHEITVYLKYTEVSISLGPAG